MLFAAEEELTVAEGGRGKGLLADLVPGDELERFRRFHDVHDTLVV
jgi:hypothetical protein